MSFSPQNLLGRRAFRPGFCSFSRVKTGSQWGAYTLVELLVVLAIIAIMTAIAVPLIPSLMRANQLDSSVNTLSGILEQAREAALAGNTFVWVAFTDPPTANPASGTWIAVFRSIDGTDSSTSTTTTSPWTSATALTIPGGNYQLINKLRNMSGVKLVKITNFSTMPPSLTTTVSAQYSSPVDLFTPPANWTVTPMKNTGNGTAPVYFTHALQFTPDGEAHAAAATTFNTNIQFGLVPTQGSSLNSVIFNVSRLTGKATVWRP